MNSRLSLYFVFFFLFRATYRLTFLFDQPINEIRNYFGEEIAMYFAFMMIYVNALKAPAVLGTMLFIIGYIADDGTKNSKTWLGRELVGTRVRRVWNILPLLFDMNVASGSIIYNYSIASLSWSGSHTSTKNGSGLRLEWVTMCHIPITWSLFAPESPTYSMGIGTTRISWDN